jgi:hypothetical protein
MAPKGSGPLGRRDLPMCEGRLRRIFDHVLQSLYTSAVVDQIIHDRAAAAARARHTPSRRRRLFGRRRAAPFSSPTGRLRVSGAGR